MHAQSEWNLSMNLKVGRAVLCGPTAATTLSSSAKNGAHGVTRPTAANRFKAPMCVQCWMSKLSMNLLRLPYSLLLHTQQKFVMP
jgi:hypothetical protein